MNDNFVTMYILRFNPKSPSYHKHMFKESVDRLSCDVCQLNIEGFVLSVLFLVSSPLRNIKVSQCKSLKIPINFPSFLLTPVQPLNLTF